MSRTILDYWNRNLFALYFFFFIGFYLGLHYWKLIIQHYCSREPIVTQESNSFYDYFQHRTVKMCQNQKSKLFLTIAILSSYERLLEYLPAIFETWYLTTTKEIEIIIFLEEKYSNTEDFIQNLFLKSNEHMNACLYIVKLKHVSNEYPPQKKGFYAMKFIYAYYQHRTSWILRLDDNAYVNIPKLVKWLKSIDHRRTLYIGQGGKGRKNESAVNFPSGKCFCMGGSGIILSQQTLIQLGFWLDQCLKFELRTDHEDVELGRCILTHIDMDCTQAYDSKLLFYHHYGPQYSFGYDFTPLILSRALILHPIKSRTTFQQIFSFYHREQQRRFKLSVSKSPNRENYVTFLNKMEFDLVRDIHYQRIDARWRSYIDTTVQSYMERLQKLWHQRSINWTIVSGKVVLGYHRVLPRHGLELIVEMLLSIRSVSASSSRVNFVRKRLHLHQPFIDKRHLNYREIINVESNEEKYRLNLIVVSRNKDQALIRFISYFQREILNYPDRQQYFSLTILYFGPTTTIVDSMYQLSVRYPLLIRLSIINETQYVYNRGLGRHLASQHFTDNQLLFFIDVDIIFTGQSLINVRRLMIHQLSISPCAVYFPVIYSSFSNMFVDNDRLIVDQESNLGLFSIYGFGNLAVRKRDLDRAGGWQTNNYEWGLEDVNLFQRFVNLSAECYVFRSVEPGLKHYYHEKVCNKIKDPTRKTMCFNAEFNLIGSQADMVDYMLNNKILND